MSNCRLPHHIIYAPPHEKPRTVEVLAYNPPAFVGDEHGWFLVREKDGEFREVSICHCRDAVVAAEAEQPKAEAGRL